MSKLSDFLNTYDFREIRLGSALPLPELAGPGIVLVLCETEPAPNSLLYEVLEAGEGNGPVAIALSFLKQTQVKSKCQGRLVAWVAVIPDTAHRKQALHELRNLIGT